jgi:hypothetical protein
VGNWLDDSDFRFGRPACDHRQHLMVESRFASSGHPSTLSLWRLPVDPPTLVRGSKLRSLAEHFEAMARALEQRQSARSRAAKILLKEVNHRVKNSLRLVATRPATFPYPDPVRRQFGRLVAISTRSRRFTSAYTG